MIIHMLLLLRIVEEARVRVPKAVITQRGGPSLETKRLGHVITATSLAISKSFATVGRENKVRSKTHKSREMIKILQQPLLRVMMMLL